MTKSNKHIEKNFLKINKMEQLFSKYENEFIQLQVSKTQTELIYLIDEVLNILDLGDPRHPKGHELGFESWGSDKIISAREKLARYSETLGEFIYYHESRSDFAYIWRKGAYASDWLPLKSKLEHELTKVTNPEVESELTKRYLAEQYYSMFHRRRADFLMRKMDAINRMIRTLDHRLREIGRQQFLPQEPHYTPPKDDQ